MKTKIRGTRLLFDCGRRSVRRFSPGTGSKGRRPAEFAEIETEKKTATKKVSYLRNMRIYRYSAPASKNPLPHRH